MPPQKIVESEVNVANVLPTNKIPTLGPEMIQVEDRIYSAKSLADMHPGGELFVKAFAGRDATEAFLSYHRREFPHSRMTESLLGSATAVKNSNADADYLELCRLVEQVLPRKKSFAPVSYYLKVAFILFSAVGLEIYIHYSKNYVWYLTAPLGLLFALIGLNIQHDANHGAISMNPMVNRVLGITQNWIGGSALGWIHQHVVQHHTETNDVNHDPDLMGSDFLRLNPLAPLLKHQLGQHVYAFALIALFGIDIIFETFNNTIKGFHKIPMSSMVKTNRIFEAGTSILFLLRWVALPIYQQPHYSTMLNVLPMFVVAGYYLAFFFIISHNFLGVHMFDKSSANSTDSFLWKQVASSSNVGGSLLCFVNGGLNYQIEHHLFPRVQHTHYPLIAPIVREFCLSKGIPYRHFPTIAENFHSCVAHLFAMGREQTPKDFHK
jgi:acyl-lipid (7-3)-desaturase (Delta-4 desaturase)